jgi:hypothetical protein
MKDKKSLGLSQIKQQEMRVFAIFDVEDGIVDDRNYIRCLILQENLVEGTVVVG